jgi:hypothetical protein
MSNKNLINGEYPNVGPFLFKYNHQDNINNTQEFKVYQIKGKSSLNFK